MQRRKEKERECVTIDVNADVGVKRRRGRRDVLAFCVLLLLLLLAYWKTEVYRGGVRCLRIIGQSNSMNMVRLAVSEGARESQLRAEAYYKSRWPAIKEAAKNFSLHPYFTHTLPPDIASISWYAMIGARTRAMAKQLRTENRDDFRIEKDRCEMYRYFARTGLPHPNVTRYYEKLAEFRTALVNGTAFSSTQRYPLFLKACHLTQGSMKAVLQIPSKEWAASHVRTILEWVDSKWWIRADDWERPWREEGNLLTDTLRPGLMVQESWHTSYNPYKYRHQAVELKVEVLWGVAYLAVTSDFHVGTVFLRDGTVEIFPGAWEQLMYSAKHELHPSMQWVTSHLECIWKLAEKAATLIACESIRIDIFLWEGHPDECVINEISINSGMQYAMHFPYLARIWAQPLIDVGYKIKDTAKPVYAV